MGNDDGIRFVVGRERGLRELLSEADVVPLLQAAVNAGACEASLLDHERRSLWSARGQAAADAALFEREICLEGEPVGRIAVRGRRNESERWNAVTHVMQAAMTATMTSNLKRMLTTEMHTEVVNLSYDELVGINKQLAESEARYRELAENLEKKVKERTIELQRAYTRMLQQEKMVSVGQLAAGVAHEINNPLGFITSNLTTLDGYIERLCEVLRLYRSSSDIGKIEARWKELKIDFIVKDAGMLIRQSLDGAGRAAKIVADLRGFSHIDDGTETSVDVNRELERTLGVLAHEIRPDTVVECELRQVPAFTANAALVSQVFYNLIRNALQTRADGLRISIASLAAQGTVRVTIGDNGPGVPEAIKDRIFDPFFTTRDVGQGTGMGLTIAYEIMQTLGGSIHMESIPGKGAVFTTVFPLKEKEHA